MEDNDSIKKEEKKTQFRWSKQMSRSLLVTLAEEVKKGNRPNNSFRRSSFVNAAKLISDKYNVQCIPDHVDSHLKAVRSTWSNLTIVRGNCGFGWDDNLKMVTVPQNVYDTYVQTYPTREKYLNRKIDMYNEMAIVVGKDIARGDFSKSFVDIDASSSLEASKSNDKGDTTSKSESETSSQARQHRKRLRVEDENSEIHQITTQLGEVVNALQKFTSNQLDVNKLYNEIMEIKGFDESLLALAFDHLAEREQLAKAFLAKDNLRIMWLENFLTKNC